MLGVAAVQFDLDAVLAVLQAARGKFEEDRAPVAARGAVEHEAVAVAQAQAGTHQHPHLGRAIHRHAAQVQLDRLAPAGGARVEAADVQLRALQDRAGDGRHRDSRAAGAQGADHVEAWRQGRLGSHRVRLRMPVCARGLAGHDPDGAVRMIGVAAAAHGEFRRFSEALQA